MCNHTPSYNSSPLHPSSPSLSPPQFFIFHFFLQYLLIHTFLYSSFLSLCLLLSLLPNYPSPPSSLLPLLPFLSLLVLFPSPLTLIFPLFYPTLSPSHPTPISLLPSIPSLLALLLQPTSISPFLPSTPYLHPLYSLPQLYFSFPILSLHHPLFFLPHLYFFFHPCDPSLPSPIHHPTLMPSNFFVFLE